MKNKRVLFLVQAAMIAAIYVALTFFSNMLGLASGTIQVRLSEALCILPVFTTAAIPGLWLGCLLGNLLTGCMAFDVIFGSIATLLGAIGTYFLRKHKILCTFPPVIANMIIVPLVLRFGYGLKVVFDGVDWSLPFHAATVAVGEVICCVVLGRVLLRALTPYKETLFRNMR